MKQKLTNQTAKLIPINMEDYFTPGFKTKPAVHIGSQTMRLYKGDQLEQSIEGLHLAAASGDDLTVLRNFDEEYIQYWDQLIGKTNVINLKNGDLHQYLVKVLLDKPKVLKEIKKKMASQATMMVYFPTHLEQELADTLKIPLHGTPSISDEYGTKSGIRRLAREAKIPMTPGYICTTKNEVIKAVTELGKRFEDVIIKHDLSSAGRWSKRYSVKEIVDWDKELDDLSGGTFAPGKDILVVEGWLQTVTSLCAHIEILPNKEPVICGGWQQIFDTDGTSYKGAGPLMLDQKSFKSFIKEVKKIASILKKKGAVGSFAPDFMLIADNEKNAKPGSCVLIELNARVPFTAFPLEIVKQVRGHVGTGFHNQYIKLSKKYTFTQIKKILAKEGLLITEKSETATGVVPYNIALLKWNMLYVVSMANSWDETWKIVKKLDKVFSK